MDAVWMLHGSVVESHLRCQGAVDASASAMRNVPSMDYSCNIVVDWAMCNETAMKAP